MTLPAEAADKRPMTFDDLMAFKRVADPQISPDGTQVVYEVTEILDVASNKKQTHLWLAATDGKTPPRQLTSSGKRDAHARWSPDGTKILFESTRGGTPQLYVLDLKAGGEAKAVTIISTGAGTGIWSPDGSHIAFVSAVYPEFSELPFAEGDKKNKEKEDAVESNPVKAKTFTKLFYRHWDDYVGDKRQHLFVCKADGSDCRDVTPGDRDAYPTSTTFSVGDDFAFSPDGTHLVFTAVPAKGEAWTTNYDICRVSIDNKSKDWETLTKNPAADNSPRFSPDGKKLAWRAQKRPGNEADKWDLVIQDCNPDGTLSGQPVRVTDKEDVSAEEFIWRGSKSFLFTSNTDGRSPLWSAGSHTGNWSISPTARGSQIGSLTLSNDLRTLCYSEARMDRPAEVKVARNIDAISITGESVSASHNAALLESLILNKPESVEVPVEGGVKMQMWVLKPPGFDPAKKWPVVYIVHGGPQVPFNDNWSFRWNAELWAAQGYVIAMPNFRGSPGWGQKYVDEISGDWGGKAYRDCVAGLDYVKKLPYVDASRMGAAGASFGGYMMNWFAVNDIAKDFKCFITHCSVWNFESMWGTTDELWFDEGEHGGLPWEVPGKYREFSPHTKAANLGKHKVPTLVIQNDKDYRCPIGQGQELFTALQRQGVPSRFINFPDEGHWVLKPANSKHWHKEVFDWLKTYAPPGGK
jgi:dipeptidyl aminopeptidase/acylaminoacyl peptidase